MLSKKLASGSVSAVLLCGTISVGSLLCACGGSSVPADRSAATSGNPAASAQDPSGSSGGSAARVNDYYVRPDGSDANDGSADNPAHAWRTINHASASLRLGPNGTVVHVASGTYNCAAGDADYTSCIITTASGTPTAWITYLSTTRWGAHIVAAGNGQICWQKLPKEACNGGTIWANAGRYVRIEGFDLTGKRAPETVSHGIINYSSDVVIAGNRIHDLPVPSAFGAGINSMSCSLSHYSSSLPDSDYLKHKCGNVWAIGNEIYNIGYAITSRHLYGPLVEGIYFSAPRENIVNNIVHDIPWGFCFDLNHFPYQDIVMNNIAYNCGRFAKGYAQGGGLQISSEEPFSMADYATVENNIFMNIQGEAALRERITGEGKLGPHNHFGYNLFFDNYQDSEICFSPPAPGGGKHCVSTLPADSIQADPMFVEADTDFHLRPGSPAIQAGTRACAPGVSTCAPQIDADGAIRPAGPIDIGPYRLDDDPVWPWY